LLVALGGVAAWFFAIGATRALGSWAQIQEEFRIWILEKLRVIDYKASFPLYFRVVGNLETIH
jgi:hypothetical protein